MRAPLERGRPILRLERLNGPGIHGIDLDVHEREIVGVAGVAGNGQAELAELICGLLPVTAGRIALDGRDVTGATVRERRDVGLAYVPDDRFKRGLAADASIGDNLIMGAHRRPPLARRGRLDGRGRRGSAPTSSVVSRSRPPGSTSPRAPFRAATPSASSSRGS